MASQQSSSSSSVQSSKSFSGIENPEALATLMALIDQLKTGGTDVMKTQATNKQLGIDKTLASLGDYTKSKAFTDSLDLITASLNKSLEAQKPAIQRAVEGAGTSASSMQGLLSQRAATDASLQAGALGAEQAKAYGQITAQLLSGLNTATSQSDPAVAALIQALDLTRISRQESSAVSSSVSQGSSTDSGGGGGGSGRSAGSTVGSSRGTGQPQAGLFDDYQPSYVNYSNPNNGQWLSTAGDNEYDWNTGTHSPAYSDSNGTYTWEATPPSYTGGGTQDTYNWNTPSSYSNSSSEWNNPYIGSNSDSYETPTYDWGSTNNSSQEWYNPYVE
jgi:hypothetical protein